MDTLSQLSPAQVRVLKHLLPGPHSLGFFSSVTIRRLCRLEPIEAVMIGGVRYYDLTSAGRELFRASHRSSK